MAIDARTAPEVPTQGEDDGGRDWIKIWVTVGLLAFFAAIGIYIAMNQGDKPAPTPTPTAVVDSQQTAYDAATKTVTDMRAWSAANPGQPASEQLATTTYVAQSKAAVDAMTAQGLRVEGADKLLWTKASDYSVQSVTVNICSEVHQRVLDQAGNNVRVDPDGKPLADGAQIGAKYRLVPGSERGSWLVESSQVTATC
jgi:hypothetical protein